MKTFYPLFAALGLLVVAILLMTAPVRDAADDENYVKTQRQHLAAQNMRLFLKFRDPDEQLSLPVVASLESAP